MCTAASRQADVANTCYCGSCWWVPEVHVYVQQVQRVMVEAEDSKALIRLFQSQARNKIVVELARFE